ncbi:MAG TPA: hypothetical protein VGM27_01445 [Acidobacteriaceae bacterium]
MRQLLLLLLALPSIGSGNAALTQSSAPLPSAPATQQNAAVITFNAAVLNTNEAQNEFADLQKKFVPREAHLKALSDEVDGLKKQLDAAGDKLSQHERASRVQTLDARNKQLQREAEDYRNDSQTESPADNPIVWYAGSEVDITAQVI